MAVRRKRRLNWTAIKNALRLYGVRLDWQRVDRERKHTLACENRGMMIRISMGTEIIVNWIIRVGGGKVP